MPVLPTFLVVPTAKPPPVPVRPPPDRCFRLCPVPSVNAFAQLLDLLTPLPTDVDRLISQYCAFLPEVLVPLDSGEVLTVSQLRYELLSQSRLYYSLNVEDDTSLLLSTDVLMMECRDEQDQVLPYSTMLDSLHLQPTSVLRMFLLDRLPISVRTALEELNVPAQRIDLGMPPTAFVDDVLHQIRSRLGVRLLLLVVESRYDLFFLFVGRLALQGYHSSSECPDRQLQGHPRF